MFTVALRMVGNEADAQDMTQEAFIKAFRNIDQFRGEVSFGAWLKRIVVNRCLDFLKARKHHFVALEEERMHIPDAEDSWETEYPVSPGEVKEAIAELPDKYRYVVQLYLVEGYDHSEISDFLDIAQTTCRSRLMRGKARLLEHLRSTTHVTGSEKNV